MLPSSASSPRPPQRTTTKIIRRSVAAQLRLFLCGCGLLYVVLLWHSGIWTTTPTTVSPTIVLHQTPRDLSIKVGGPQPPNRPGITPTTTIQRESPRSAPLAVPSPEIEAVEPPTKPLVAPSTTTPTPTSPSTTTPTTPVTTTPTLSHATSTPPLIDGDWLRSVLLMQLTSSPSSPPLAAAISYEAHSARMDALESQRVALAETLARLKARFADVNAKIQVHAAVIADEDAKLVRELPRAYKQQGVKRAFRCLGWRATADCDPNSRRVPANDRPCEQSVPAKEAGYCEIEDTVTKERFRVMKTACDSLRWDAALRCFDAWDFPNFAIQADDALRNATLALERRRELMPSDERQEPQTRGVVIVVYPKMLPSAYVTVRTLRRLGCVLPVELWYKTSELENAATNAIVANLIEYHGPVTLRAIDNPEVKGFTTKIHSIQHSAFDHVLFLDADNVPVKDPTYLFDLPEYRNTGALFWPDFWHPNHTIFALHNRSLVWEYLDLDYVDMFEQESGQLVVDKSQSQRAFSLLNFYAHHQPNLLDSFKIVHGDKDLFRFAWMKSNSSFYMVDRPPAVAGSVIDGAFCGQTMAQFDPSGELLFLHRNAKKLRGRQIKHKPTLVPGEAISDKGEEEVDPEIWTHLLQLKPTSTRADYTIDIYEAPDKFPKGQWCYGKKSPASPHFNTFRFADLPARDIENEIRAYAIEATDLLQANDAKDPQRIS